jgi:polar amino acid transport system substrate-binding protein
VHVQGTGEAGVDLLQLEIGVGQKHRLVLLHQGQDLGFAAGNGRQGRRACICAEQFNHFVIVVETSGVQIGKELLVSRKSVPWPVMRAPLAALAGTLLSLSLGLPHAAQAESVVQRVTRTGQLKVLVMNDDLPYTTAQGNGYTGLAMEFVAEVQKALSQALGKPVQVKPVPIQSVNQGLSSITTGTADIACGVTYTWGASMVVDYTLPFGLSGIRLLTPPGNDGTPTALVGQRIGVVKNSLAEATLAAAVPKASLVPLDNPQAALNALGSGQVKFLAGDSLWLMANRSRAGASTNLAPAVPYNRSAVACIVPENNSGILNISNLAIARLMQAYINDDPQALSRINQWIGPGSTLNLNQGAIKSYFTNVLLSVALVDRS